MRSKLVVSSSNVYFVTFRNYNVPKFNENAPWRWNATDNNFHATKDDEDLTKSDWHCGDFRSLEANDDDGKIIGAWRKYWRGAQRLTRAAGYHRFHILDFLVPSRWARGGQNKRDRWLAEWPDEISETTNEIMKFKSGTSERSRGQFSLVHAKILGRGEIRSLGEIKLIQIRFQLVTKLCPRSGLGCRGGASGEGSVLSINKAGIAQRRGVVIIHCLIKVHSQLVSKIKRLEPFCVKGNILFSTDSEGAFSSLFEHSPCDSTGW